MSEYKRNIIPMNQKVEKIYVAGHSEELIINDFRRIVFFNPYGKPTIRDRFSELHSILEEFDRLKAESLPKGAKNE